MSARTTTTKGLRAAVEVERSLSRLKPERPALGSGIRPEAPLAPCRLSNLSNPTLGAPDHACWIREHRSQGPDVRPGYKGNS